jgi:hypothetical protein
MKHLGSALFGLTISSLIILLGCEPLDSGNGNPSQAQPKPTPPATSYVCRWQNVPAGWAIVDYKSNPAACPDPPGYTWVFTQDQIEQYSSQPVGAIIRICTQVWGSSPSPPGWSVTTGPPVSPTVCPREPGDITQGPTAYYIKRMY